MKSSMVRCPLRLARRLAVLALLLCVPATRGAETSVDNATVAKTATQTTGGTNIFNGDLAIGIDTNDAPLTIGGWADDEYVMIGRGTGESGTNFAFRMDTSASDLFKIEVGGVEAMILCQNGKIGIGVPAAYMTNGATAGLDVVGDMRISSGKRLIFSSGTSADEDWSVHTEDSGAVLLFEEKEYGLEAMRIEKKGSACQFVMKPSSTNEHHVYWTSTGRLGIGTNEPAERVHVAGNAEFAAELTVDRLEQRGDIPMGSYTNGL